MSDPNPPPHAAGATATAPPTAAATAANVGATALKMLVLGYIERYLWRLVRPYLPSTILKNAEKAARKAIDNAIWGCVFSVVFFALFGAAVVAFAAVVLYAVWSTIG